MNKKVILLFLLCLVLATCVGLVACNDNAGAGDVRNKGDWTVTSPDGTISVNLVMDAQNALSLSVKKGNVTVLDKSTIGFDIVEDDFNLVKVANVSQQNVSGSYANISGKTSSVEYNCNETVVTLEAWTFYLDIVLRAYDDGYAFRYGIRAKDDSEGVATVIEEKTYLNIPDGTVTWAQNYSTNTSGKDCYSYEEGYVRRSKDGLTNEILAMPLIYKVKGADVYSLVTESQLIGSGFYGSFLEVGQDENKLLHTVHNPASVQKDDNKIEYPFESPWRVGITGDMKTVNESELVEKVYDDVEYWKPDDYDQLTAEEQEVFNYDWVESGVAAWNWLVWRGKRMQYNLELENEYLDLAVSMGWKYTVLDSGWNSHWGESGAFTEQTFRDFVQRAHDKGVKVIVWCNALVDFGNGNLDILKATLDKWADYGIDGIKIDFFDGQNATNPKHQGEDSDNIEWYEHIYQETARRKMVVNCHGSNKPTGERRVYPNVINREAIYGNEFTTVGSSYTVNSMFVREVVGPSDFTPVVNPLSNQLTMAHQMALAILYESGQPNMADFSTTYDNALIRDFYKNIPSLRDETVFLEGELDYYYVAAVKSGDSWFVAGINSVVDQSVTIDFSFLGEGNYQAEIFVNNATNRKSVDKTTKTITSSSTETISMTEDGGFVIRLTPTK